MGRILSSLVLTLIAGLLLGAAVHILTIFAIPHLAERNAYARFGTASSASDLLFPGTEGRPPLPQPDPAVAVAVCSFDLSKGPMIASAKLDASFASLSVHARGGEVLYAVTDQAATRGQVTLTLMPQAYFDEFVADNEEATANVLRLVTAETRGLVVIRVLATFPTEMTDARKAAESLACTPQPSESRS